MIVNSRLVYASISIVLISLIVMIIILPHLFQQNLTPKNYLKIFSKNEKEFFLLELRYPDVFSNQSDVVIKDTLQNKTIDTSKISFFAYQSEDLFLNRHPRFLVWGMLISIMIAISIGLLPMYCKLINIFIKDYNFRAWKISVYILLAIIIGIICYFIHITSQKLLSAVDIITDFGILFKIGIIVDILNFIPLACSVFGVAVLLMIPKAADSLSKNLEVEKDINVTISLFKKLDLITMILLYSLATIIAFSVLTTGALRESIGETIEVKGFDIFPVEIVYSYGLFFTVFLAFIYLPVQFYLKIKTIEIIDKLKKITRDFDVNEMKIESYIEELDVKATPFSTFTTSLTILAPLISSLLPGYLHI